MSKLLCELEIDAACWEFLAQRIVQLGGSARVPGLPVRPGRAPGPGRGLGQAEHACAEDVPGARGGDHDGNRRARARKDGTVVFRNFRKENSACGF